VGGWVKPPKKIKKDMCVGFFFLASSCTIFKLSNCEKSLCYHCSYTIPGDVRSYHATTAIQC
jgi:hypothetical protein